MNARRIVIAIAAGAAVLSASAGCNASREAPQGQDDATILSIATATGPDRPGAVQIDEFARRVNEISRGEIRIDPVLKAAGDEADAWNHVVAQSVEAGDFDMALIPTRTWEGEGVTSFAGLSAPFLVDSDELMARLVSPDAAAGMLAGLDEVGLTGLALFPEGQRLLFSFDGPLLAPSDVDGKLVRAPRSETTYSALTSLGAQPRALVGDLFTAALEDGTLTAAESSYEKASSFAKASTVVGNLPLYPKINSLVVNSATLTHLTANERRILQEAATKSRDQITASMTPTADWAASFCQKGGTVVSATEEQIAAFKTATAPVYAQLEKDPGTKALIATIRSLAAETTASTETATCSHAP